MLREIPSHGSSEKNTAINQVMWLWGESYLLGGFVNRISRRRGMIRNRLRRARYSGNRPLCQSGGRGRQPARHRIFQLQRGAKRKAQHRFCSERSLQFDDGTCDLLVSNVPYAPDTAARASDNFWSGGIDGTELLQRVVEALPQGWTQTEQPTSIPCFQILQERKSRITLMLGLEAISRSGTSWITPGLFRNIKICSPSSHSMVI